MRFVQCIFKNPYPKCTDLTANRQHTLAVHSADGTVVNNRLDQR